MITIKYSDNVSTLARVGAEASYAPGKVRLTVDRSVDAEEPGVHPKLSVALDVDEALALIAELTEAVRESLSM